MAIEMPPVEGHPNREPFRGVLTLVDVPSDRPAKLIAEILAAVTVAGPSGVELFLKLESLLNLGPDEQANVAAAIKAGLTADAETIAAVEAWKQQVGV